MILGLAVSSGAIAQQGVVSPAAEAVSVTVYRNPDRALGRNMDLGWLGGYALISETRTIDLPAGESEIRFEGVADTLLPASVIVSGLPQQPAEKNYDARLLSPGALIDAFLGQQVHIRRTHKKTGKVTESEAIIRSGPNGIVLQTADGFEALKCTGIPETLIYPGVPEGLSDKPTLTLKASSAEPVRRTVRLSYLASQFDWQANYIAMLNPNGRTLDLFAWLTLANGNDSSFAAAQTQAVAGEPNREDDSRYGRPYGPQIQLQCWPSGNTSSPPQSPYPPPPPAPERDEGDEYDSASIVVTGSRISAAAMVAAQEDLGDLKLYRIPERVTVAANAQKQVAFLVRNQVRYERLYSVKTAAEGEFDGPQPISILIRTKNLKDRGLGLPLPSGRMAIFETVDGRSILAGEPTLEDKAVGEDVEVIVGQSPDVNIQINQVGEGPPDQNGYFPRRMEVQLSNARSKVAAVEVELLVNDEERLVRPSRKLRTKNGRPLWIARVPANKRITLAYTIERVPERTED